MRARHIKTITAAIILAFASLSYASDITPRVSEKLYGLTGLHNVGRLSPTLYRGAQPEAEGYATLKAMGIRTVINFRTTHSEADAVGAAGMRSVEIPLDVTEELPEDTVARIMSVINDPEAQPVFFHCRQGVDRTGIIAAIYRITAQGWSMQEAVAEMEDFGYHGMWRDLKETLERYSTPGKSAR